jgi:hypothetical protein
VLPARWVVWSRGAFLAALLGTIAPVAAHAQEPEVDPVADSVQADTTGQADDDAKGHLDIGGAVRLNYFWQDYNQPRRDRGGDFGFELFRLDVDGDYEAIDLSVQYRWYAFFEAVHHAYFAYQPGPGWDLHLGISQVPFGILPYASHSFWFGATYYMGYEDDYDMGLKLLFTNGPWEVQAAFYKNAEYIDASRTARYSFDLVTSGEQANQEINQWNLRAAREWRPVAWLIARVGASAEYGQIYNDITTLKGNRRAFALHADFVAGTWNLQLQGIDYRYRPENPPGVDPNTVQLAAFTFPFLMASEGRVATVNLAKDFVVGARLLDTIKCYADLSKVFPRGPSVHTSTQAVTGCLLVKGGLYTYVDVITGQNMWFAGGPGIGLDRPEFDEWNSRLNVNFGFYF